MRTARPRCRDWLLAAVLGLTPGACGDVGEPPPVARPGDSVLQRALGGEADPGFARALEPRDFDFPADHGPHPAFRNEWWYFTGVLHAEGGRAFGFELTFFRVALQPGELRERWRSNQIYFAHFAVSDPHAGRFHAFERVSRPGPGLAGAAGEPFAVWIEDWSVRGSGGNWRLRARDGDLAVDLRLAVSREPVSNGERGLSRRSAVPGNASFYYSVPRIAAQGDVRIGATRHPVQGLVWLDREWSTGALSADQVGWDWFALHLDDGSNLMIYRLRDADGQPHAYSAGTWSYADGRVEHLGREDFRATALTTWRAPDGSRYPIEWRLELPRHDASLRVAALMAPQWLDVLVPYWEGAVRATGARAGQPLAGEGYLEMTGYAVQ